MGNENSAGTCCCEREKEKSRTNLYLIKQFGEDLDNSKLLINVQSTEDSNSNTKVKKKKKKTKGNQDAKLLNESKEIEDYT